jgi:hypothetical protein
MLSAQIDPVRRRGIAGEAISPGGVWRLFAAAAMTGGRSAAHVPMIGSRTPLQLVGYKFRIGITGVRFNQTMN